MEFTTLHCQTRVAIAAIMDFEPLLIALRNALLTAAALIDTHLTVAVTAVIRAYLMVATVCDSNVAVAVPAVLDASGLL
jgi:hypothetical protein